ncbi:RraA family protein [Microbacterium betulae]|uniref:Putative 4-hydroxy-4-methyl-2-oxoglutarate aldolase n=1 Tax=Microbacterium betulae TaxID=2981139 RepID=A0AA97FH28_9MICO|nr:4-carboxy-4-hydroxy-2-oxoadipate aldolase/oxaloacetate decarboxylase [Microbacterium sp. AB]WOF22870.1 RraA family protein [Microbacterium sp. AB]
MAGIRDRLAALDSCAVSDALDTLGLPGAVTGIHGITLPDAAILGVARTVLAGPREAGGPQAHIAAGLVDRLQPGDVVVIANDGRADVSCWGGLLGAAATSHGAAGVVVDGAFRDIQENADLGLPVFARAAVAVSARGRIVQKSMDEPVRVGGVEVAPGDWVVADRSGLAFVPAAEAERVVALAERIVAREESMLSAVHDGRPVAEAMHDSEFPTAE